MAALDHLVYATPDLDATVAALADATGVTATPGGRNEGRGTRNALLGLAGTAGYLELIGPDPEQPAPTAAAWFGIDTLTQPRLVTWAVRVSGIDDAVEQARAAGYDPGPVSAMSRRRADGLELTWRMTVASESFDGVVPFLIDWGESPHPSVGLPALTLVAWSAEHPAPDKVGHALDAMHVDLPLRQAPEARLRAVVEGPGGSYELG